MQCVCHSTIVPSRQLVVVRLGLTNLRGGDRASGVGGMARLPTHSPRHERQGVCSPRSSKLSCGNTSHSTLMFHVAGAKAGTLPCTTPDLRRKVLLSVL